MLEKEIVVPETELYDEKSNTFIATSKQQKLLLKHSLLSVSKWEALTHKSFFTDTEKRTDEEKRLYLQCMTVNANVDPYAYYAVLIYPNLVKEIADYINDPMTATTFSHTRKGGRSSEITTSELIYYWMTELNIPKECEKWHLNRLLTLIRVCEVKKGKQEKMPKRSLYAQNREINAMRRARYHSKG